MKKNSVVKSKSASPCSSKIWDYKFYSLNYLLYIKLYVNSKRGSNIATPKCTHQESSPSTAEFRIWVSTYGLGGRGRVGRSGGLVTEGEGVFAAIRAWLVGGIGYAPGCTVGTVSPVSSPSCTESSSMGLSTEFRLLEHFRGPIPSAWGFILGAGLLLWVDGQFCGRFHGRLIVIRDCIVRGVDLGWWLHLPWHGGPILVMFEAGCAWSS